MNPNTSRSRPLSSGTLALSAFLAFALLTTLAAAQSSPAPQPRLRLDPSSHSAVPDAPKTESQTPPAASPGSATAAPVTMDRFIVRSNPLPTFGPKKEPEPTGNFSPLRGGRFFQTDLGRFHTEVGLWPWFDIFEGEGTFKAHSARINVDFLRITW